MNKFSFLSVALLSLSTFSASFGSVPPAGQNTNDTAIYQNMSEITVPRQGKITFDSDLQRLNQMEPKFHERLPRLADRPELARPIHRISTQKYVPSSRRQKAGQAPRHRAVSRPVAHKPVVEAVDPESPSAQPSKSALQNRH